LSVAMALILFKSSSFNPAKRGHRFNRSVDMQTPKGMFE
jgi:hypothetical protein